MARAIRLQVVRNERARKQAKDLRGKFYREARASFHALGDKVAGFSIVIWDDRAHAATSLFTQGGPVGGSKAPGFTRDCLNQHVASELVDTPPAPNDETNP